MAKIKEIVKKINIPDQLFKTPLSAFGLVSVLIVGAFVVADRNPLGIPEQYFDWQYSFWFIYAPFLAEVAGVFFWPKLANETELTEGLLMLIGLFMVGWGATEVVLKNGIYYWPCVRGLAGAGVCHLGITLFNWDGKANWGGFYDKYSKWPLLLVAIAYFIRRTVGVVLYDIVCCFFPKCAKRILGGFSSLIHTTEEKEQAGPEPKPEVKHKQPAPPPTPPKRGEARQPERHQPAPPPAPKPASSPGSPPLDLLIRAAFAGQSIGISRLTEMINAANPLQVLQERLGDAFAQAGVKANPAAYVERDGIQLSQLMDDAQDGNWEERAASIIKQLAQSKERPAVMAESPAPKPTPQPHSTPDVNVRELVGVLRTAHTKDGLEEKLKPIVGPKQANIIAQAKASDLDTVTALTNALKEHHEAIMALVPEPQPE